MIFFGSLLSQYLDGIHVVRLSCGDLLCSDGADSSISDPVDATFQTAIAADRAVILIDDLDWIVPNG